MQVTPRFHHAPAFGKRPAVKPEAVAEHVVRTHQPAPLPRLDSGKLAAVIIRAWLAPKKAVKVGQ